MDNNINSAPIPLTNATFVSSKESLCYQDVIDNFAHAEYIDIITYSISQSQDFLLDALKQAGNRNIPIRLVTNIPNRWNSYWTKLLERKPKKHRAISTQIETRIYRENGQCFFSTLKTMEN